MGSEKDISATTRIFYPLKCQTSEEIWRFFMSIIPAGRKTVNLCRRNTIERRSISHAGVFK